MSSFRVMTPRPDKKQVEMTSNASPSFSAYGRSPSIGPPAYTTDDLVAARYQKFSRWLHWLRIALTTLILVASIAVISCAGVALQAYHDSQLSPHWLLPVWPLSVDLRPTHTILGCGISILLLSLVYLIIAFIPMPRKLRTLNIISTLLSFLSLFAALFTTIFVSVITSNLNDSTSSGSLNTWTCKWEGFKNEAPGSFMEICNSENAALDVVILLLILEVMAVGAAAVGWLVEMRFRKRGLGADKSQVELV